MRWVTRILTISLLITLVLVSGCMLNFGTTKLDFGTSDEAQKALACFSQTYGDPSAYTGPPRFIAPLASTGLKNNIPQDKVTSFSTGTDRIFFWVIYQNFEQSEDLHLTWQFQNNDVATITKKTDSRSGIAFGEFIRPDTGWPEGTHTIKIEGKGNSTQVTFAITSGQTERTIFDFTSPGGLSCPVLMTYIPVTQPAVSTTITQPVLSTTVIPTATQPVVSTLATPPTTGGDYWISGRTVNPAFTCYPPNNIVKFLGNTGPAVPPGTPLQLKIFNIPDSGNNDLPREGVSLGPTNTLNDRSWVFTWDGSVEGYGLIQNQEYMVKVILPDGTYTKVSLPYQCLGTEAPNWWISDNGRQVLSCSPPNNTIRFMGKTGSDVLPGTRVTLKLFHMADSGTREILIGSTDVRNDGSYEYTWNGYVNGYTFKNGQEYTIKDVLPGGRYTKQNFVYQCQT